MSCRPSVNITLHAITQFMLKNHNLANSIFPDNDTGENNGMHMFGAWGL